MSKKKISLACSVCGSRNYTIVENLSRTERLEVKNSANIAENIRFIAKQNNKWGFKMKFFKSVVQTMKDTTWLNAKETRRDTTTVVVMSIAFAVFFGVVDYAVQAVLSLIA